jgi:hypothetical protein
MPRLRAHGNGVAKVTIAEQSSSNSAVIEPIAGAADVHVVGVVEAGEHGAHVGDAGREGGRVDHPQADAEQAALADLLADRVVDRAREVEVVPDIGRDVGEVVRL